MIDVNFLNKNKRRIHQFTSIDAIVSSDCWEDYKNEPFVKIEQDWKEYKLYALTSWIDYNLKLLVLKFLYFNNYKNLETVFQNIYELNRNKKIKKIIGDRPRSSEIIKLFKENNEFRSFIYELLFTSEITMGILIGKFFSKKNLYKIQLNLLALHNFNIERNKVIHKYFTEDEIEKHIENAIKFGLEIKKYFDNFIIVNLGEISEEQRSKIIKNFIITRQSPALIDIMDVLARKNLIIPPECLKTALEMLKDGKYCGDLINLNGGGFNNISLNLQKNLDVQLFIGRIKKHII